MQKREKKKMKETNEYLKNLDPSIFPDNLFEK